MSEMRNLIESTAEKIFEDLCSKNVVDAAEEGKWPRDLWQALEDSGLTLAAVPEELGGSGGTLGDAMAVLKLSGRHAAPIPLAETFLAGWILSSCGLDVPLAPMSVGVLDSIRGSVGRLDDGSGWTLSGPCRGVPWASQVSRIVLAIPTDGAARIAVVEPSESTITHRTNLAGEPRGDMVFADLHLTDERLVSADTSITPATIRRMGALCRAVQMAGALERMLDLSVEHANMRVQFGRPIGSFQAVRQQLAVAAGQVAAASKAAEIAVDATEAGGGELEVAVAKARVGEAAGIVAETAHQVHGAMGITHEHSLHQFTRRVWSWRDDFGREQEWQAEIGHDIASNGADNLWQFITQS